MSVSVWAAIQMERRRQDDKWGVNAQRTVSLEARLCILLEEVGEVAQVVNDLRNENPNILNQSRLREMREMRECLHKELIQVAACAVAWLEVIPS